MCIRDRDNEANRVWADEQSQKTVPVAAGLSYSLAIDKDGSIWAWGRNSYNQLGLGRVGSGAQASAVKVAEMKDVIAVTAGTHHTIALKNDGTVWGWGHNAVGQLGDGNKITQKPFSTMIPVQTQNLKDIIAVEAGAKDYTLALKKDGTVWTWGSNTYGNIGDGTTTDRLIPTKLTGFDNVMAIGTGTWHSMLVNTDGTVWAWGMNYYGCLGDGTTVNRSNTPVQVMYVPDLNKPEERIPFTGVKTVDGGLSHSVALKNDGTVWTWGYNAHGQLGNGTWANSRYPTQVLDLDNITEIAAGSGFNLALRSDGTVWTWGQGQKGEHGLFTEVTGALDPDGKPSPFYTYGEEFHHQLDRNVPVQIPGLKNIIAIAAGESHGIAVDKDGVVWTWGFNDYGQIGNSFVQSKGYPLSNPLNYLDGGPPKTLIIGMQQLPVLSQPSGWAVAEIEAAKSYGLVTSRVLSNYQTPITREEFCELAVKLYESVSGEKAQPAPSDTFSDADNLEILKAYNLGIAAGVGDGKFAPNNQVTREQIAVMFHRAMQAGKPNLQAPIAQAPAFKDAGQVSGWAQEAVADMSARGIISGMGDERFNPKETATREQAIALVKRAYELLK
jgi:alpha-tubulin suppressor-like RCC1 family protein